VFLVLNPKGVAQRSPPEADKPRVERSGTLGKSIVQSPSSEGAAQVWNEDVSLLQSLFLGGGSLGFRCAPPQATLCRAFGAEEV
jgi:hypothetical protein